MSSNKRVKAGTCPKCGGADWYTAIAEVVGLHSITLKECSACGHHIIKQSKAPAAKAPAGAAKGLSSGKRGAGNADKKGLFLYAWGAYGLNDAPPQHSPELMFNKPLSRHRFDFAWPQYKIAVEVDGGQWAPGGGFHNRDGDRNKLNIAASLGWRVYRFSPDMLKSDPAGCINLVLKGMGYEWGN